MQQIEQISNLIKVLGLYVLVDREQLNHFAEKTYGEKVGLSYIQKAVKYNLIAEIQSDDIKDEYYFQLKSGGFCFLDAIGFKYRKLKLDAAMKERQQILSINNYLIKNNHILTHKYGLQTFEPLFTEDDIVLVINHDIEYTVKQINEQLFTKDTEIEEVYDIFSFEKIDINNDVNFTRNAKGNVESTLF